MTIIQTEFKGNAVSSAGDVQGIVSPNNKIKQVLGPVVDQAGNASIDPVSSAAHALEHAGMGVTGTVVILGSSNGAGVGSSTYTADPSAANGWASPSTSWAGRLATALGSGWKVINRSISGLGQKTTQTVIEAVDAGLIDLATGMKELKAQSHTTGIFSNITDEAIEEAEQMPPPSAGELEPPNADPGQAADPIAAIASGAPQPEGAGPGQAGRALLRLAASAGRDSGWALGKWLSSRKPGRTADH